MIRFELSEVELDNIAEVFPEIEWVFELVGERMWGCAILNFTKTSLA